MEVISIPVTPFGMVPWESSVGECGIIDLDSIVPVQPETILRYQRPIKKYATGILSDASATTLNSCSVFSIRHLAQSPAIVQASEVGAISLCVSLPHYHAPFGVGNYRGS